MISISIYFKGAFNRISRRLHKYEFRRFGTGSIYYPYGSSFLPKKNISIGCDVHIGEETRIWCTGSEVIIKDHVVFGPRVSIIAGNHSFHIPGKWITQYKKEDKRQQDDLPVIINEDVWVGTNVTILNGVTIGRGCIIAAGSVVTRSFPPYSVIGGVPAKVIRWRFSINEIMVHEQKLFPEDNRLELDELEIYKIDTNIMNIHNT